MVLSDHQQSDFIYVRVANDLREKVLAGGFKQGEPLPRQHDLAAQYNVAFATLKKALDILETEGYVVRRIGRGTYASLPPHQVRKALVVDDEEVIRQAISTILDREGWECVAVDSGEEGLKAFSKERFDLTFLDLVMPGMNGVRTFQEIRKADPKAMVVIVTAYFDSDLMSEALEVGPFAVMKKPFDLAEMRIILGHAERGVQPNRTTRRPTAGSLGTRRFRE